MIRISVLSSHRTNGFGAASICVFLSRYNREASVRSSSFAALCHISFAEPRYPGTVDEKLSSEVETYVWMQDRCADVRIPHLYGFGFSDHRHVSSPYCLVAPRPNDDWNVTCLIDLEWVYSLPAEMLAVPYWLTGRGIDEIADELSEFDEVRREFMSALEEEEAKICPKNKPTLASIMHESWESKAVWFWRCLTSVNAMFFLVDDHFCPCYFPLSSKIEEVLSQYWCQGSAGVVARKAADHKEYVKELEVLFSKQSA